MTVEQVTVIATFIASIIIGLITKRFKLVNSKLIPIQNIIIGLIVALIEFYITKDFSVAIALSGITAGGTYDIIHNLNKLVNDSETLQKITDESLLADDLEEDK